MQINNKQEERLKICIISHDWRYRPKTDIMHLLERKVKGPNAEKLPPRNTVEVLYGLWTTAHVQEHSAWQMSEIKKTHWKDSNAVVVNLPNAETLPHVVLTPQP